VNALDWMRTSSERDVGRRREGLLNSRIALTAFTSLVAVLAAGCSGGEATPIEPTPDIAASGSETQLPTAVLDSDAASAQAPAEAVALALHIDAFEDGGAIPDTHTCIGDNESPAVSWSGVPAEAQSLVLIVYDADAGADLGAGNELGFLHWMVYDIPPTTAGLPLAATGNARALAGAIETFNDFSGASGATFPGGAAIRGTGYDGPCPPAQHTYVFRLLALSQPLGLAAGTPYQTVMSALEGRVLAAADWTGLYPPSQ
jgi:Raf kinase inhibitor-like YbhB/YbcL family protein